MIDSPAIHFDLEHLCHLMLSKAWIVILFVILSLMAAIGYLMWAPKIYEPRAVLEVAQETPKVNNIQDFNDDGTGSDKSTEALKTIEQALMSDTLLLKVVKANALDKDPLFAPPMKDGSAYLDTQLVALIRSKVNVKLRRGTRLIDV